MKLIDAHELQRRLDELYKADEMTNEYSGALVRMAAMYILTKVDLIIEKMPAALEWNPAPATPENRATTLLSKEGKNEAD